MAESTDSQHKMWSLLKTNQLYDGMISLYFSPNSTSILSVRTVDEAGTQQQQNV